MYIYTSPAFSTVTSSTQLPFTICLVWYNTQVRTHLRIEEIFSACRCNYTYFSTFQDDYFHFYQLGKYMSNLTQTKQFRFLLHNFRNRIFHLLVYKNYNCNQSNQGYDMAKIQFLVLILIIPFPETDSVLIVLLCVCVCTHKHTHINTYTLTRIPRPFILES